jgi:hypothetical protein
LEELIQRVVIVGNPYRLDEPFAGSAEPLIPGVDALDDCSLFR